MKIKKGYKYYVEYRECTFPEHHLYVRSTENRKVDVIVVWDKNGYYGTYFYNVTNDKIERISFYDNPRKVGAGEYTNDYVECFKGYSECMVR